jgi:hypothetical protein
MLDISLVVFPAYERTFVRLLDGDAIRAEMQRAEMRMIAQRTGLPLGPKAPPLGAHYRRDELPAVARWIRVHRPVSRVGRLDSERAA